MRRRRCRAWLGTHHDEPASRQVADQVFSRDPRHDLISMMNAPISVIPEGVGESIGDCDRIGGTGQG
jgi:hypothetical protein